MSLQVRLAYGCHEVGLQGRFWGFGALVRYVQGCHKVGLGLLWHSARGLCQLAAPLCLPLRKVVRLFGIAGLTADFSKLWGWRTVIFQLSSFYPTPSGVPGLAPIPIIKIKSGSYDKQVLSALETEVAVFACSAPGCTRRGLPTTPESRFQHEELPKEGSKAETAFLKACAAFPSGLVPDVSMQLLHALFLELQNCESTSST